ncbi:MAG: serine hydrolase [Acidobacteria bacterium]|nr:serine hydrolase [Acidobacteriota bacterium]
MKSRSRLLAGTLSCLLVACGSGTVERGPTEEMAEVMAEFARLGIFSGTVLVAEGGEIVYAEAFGEADKDRGIANNLETRYNIGSIGKTITGVSIMQLVEQGKVALDAPVSTYLEDFPYGDAITIHHLLSHTSGMFNYMAHPEYRARMPELREIDDWLPLVYDQQLVFEPPGSRFAYSNSGIVTLGAVIEQVTGMPYEDYIRENILDPAGMDSTGLDYPEDEVPNRALGYTRSVSGESFIPAAGNVPPASADGGIETTVGDLLAFDRALYGDTLLSESSKQKMYTPNLEDYGYCWRVAVDNGRRSVGHGGGTSGVSAMFSRFPDDDVTIIVLSNYTEAAMQPARALEAIYFGDEYDPPKPPLGEVVYRELKNGPDAVTVGVLDALVEKGGYEIRGPFELNMLGYELLGEGETEMAIAVFELNLSRFPDDPNCYDSLAEAHLTAGDLGRAIEFYRKALEIDPGFENSKRMLEQLKAEEDEASG